MLCTYMYTVCDHTSMSGYGGSDLDAKSSKNDSKTKKGYGKRVKERLQVQLLVIKMVTVKQMMETVK